jgi:uncharacterized membrane protein YfcA
MPEFAGWQWAVGTLCAFLIGVAKTGLPGVAAPVVPLMVLTVGDARLSAGYVLPMLCVADLFAVWYWRRHAAAGRLFSLTPWVLVGVALGAAALSLAEQTLRPVIGVIVLVMMALYVRRRLRPEAPFGSPHPLPYGIAAGFATTVANAAGPVMNLYLLSKRLPKEEFIATGAWFFFIINLSKIPIYVGHGLFSTASLGFNLLMVPAISLGAVTGKWVVQHVSPRLFEGSVIVLTLVSALLLFR